MSESKKKRGRSTAEEKLTHCPEENGITERANRTVREALDSINRFQAEGALKSIIEHYKHTQLHSALSYLRPVDYYRGDAVQLHQAR